MLLERITLYKRRQKITSLNTIELLDPYVYINNPHWQSSGNIIFLCKYYSYFRYTGRMFLGCALFVARCNVIRASCETKKEGLSFKENIQRNLREGHKLFDCTHSFLCNSLLLSLSTPFPFTSDVLAQWHAWVVFCDDIMS